MIAMMPEPPANPEPVVYQLRVVLRGVSPLIWRRLLLRSDSTIADLHATLQTVLAWSSEHLHRFVIQGRVYGAEGCGDPRRIRLVDLRLRVSERFLYEYDFIDGWQHDVRVEGDPVARAGTPLPRVYRWPTRSAA
jgi:hypothetical protein